MTAIGRTVQRRECALPSCPVLFETPHGGTWAAAYCSPGCHRASKGTRPAKPRAAIVTRPAQKRARSISPASPEQRAEAASGGCVVCNAAGCHSAHLIDRSLAADPEGDPRAIVRLCARHHREYDEGTLSLLEHLEPGGRASLAYAVERFGLLRTLQRITNARWTPVAPADETIP